MPSTPRTVTPAPQPTYIQAEQRQRRRQWLRIVYRGEFDLTAEVRDILEPLAQQAAALPRPAALRPEADAVADAVHQLLSTAIGMLAESRKLTADAHHRTARAARDLAQRPREPQIGGEHLADGTWAALLAGHVKPHAGDLADYLGRALPPNDPRLTGPSASERLEAAYGYLTARRSTLNAGYRKWQPAKRCRLWTRSTLPTGRDTTPSAPNAHWPS